MHCMRFSSWKVWHLNWHGPYITVTDLSTTLFWQPVLWLWRWLMHRLPKHQSIQQQSYLGQGYEPGWSYSTYSHVWNDSRVQTIHFKRTLLIFCGCLNNHKGVFKVSSHGNYPLSCYDYNKNELILWQLDLVLGKIHLQVTTDFPFPRKQNPAYNEDRFKLRWVFFEKNIHIYRKILQKELLSKLFKLHCIKQ